MSEHWSPVGSLVVTRLSSINCAPIDLGETTSVEVRHEGPTGRKSRRRSSLISSTGSIPPQKRSKSAESREEERSEGSDIRVNTIELSRPPSSLEEARERIRV